MVVEQSVNYRVGSGMLTINEVATILHAHPSSVRRWAKQGLIKCYRVGMRGDRRFKPEHVDEFIQAGAEVYRNGNGDHSIRLNHRRKSQASGCWPSGQHLSYLGVGGQQ